MTDILSEAKQLISDDRRKQYGPVAKGFEDAAEIAGLILDSTEWDLMIKERRIMPTVIVKMLMATKLARQAFKHKRDNLVDLAGYTGLLAILEEPQNEAETVDLKPEQLIDLENARSAEINPVSTCVWKFYRIDKPVMKDVNTFTGCFKSALDFGITGAKAWNTKLVMIDSGSRVDLTICSNGVVVPNSVCNPKWVMDEIRNYTSEVA